ncbi:MAG: putative photosynthetic complex assembly protein PuhE [Shimia sp.]
MSSALVAMAVALGLWWFSTGIILLAVRRADRAGMSGTLVLWGLPFLAFGLFAAWDVRGVADVIHAYVGFVAALAVWGWIELAFLSGVVTGPRRAPLGAVVGLDRFRGAWAIVAWHELALLAGLLGLVALSWGQPNAMAAWTFGVLYLARVLAKLNLFLGVPGINLEAIPRALSHVPSCFRRGPPGWFFAASITLLGLLTALLIAQLGSASSDAERVSLGLLAALAALATFEHWMMLLPMADTKMWRWLMPAPETKTTGETA